MSYSTFAKLDTGWGIRVPMTDQDDILDPGAPVTVHRHDGAIVEVVIAKHVSTAVYDGIEHGLYKIRKGSRVLRSAPVRRSLPSIWETA